MTPAMSSRYFAAAAIMARAESFTVEGAWPSAQLIVPSALALLLAIFDHLKKDIACPRKAKGPCRAVRSGNRVISRFSGASRLRLARAGMFVLNEVGQRAAKTLFLGVLVVR